MQESPTGLGIPVFVLKRLDDNWINGALRLLSNRKGYKGVCLLPALGRDWKALS
jgi:hypothetical protein